MFVNKPLLINLIATCCWQRAAPGRVVAELVGNRAVWYEHFMTGGVFLVRRRHVDHGLVRICACPCLR
jgi:hypothetical protein